MQPEGARSGPGDTDLVMKRCAGICGWFGLTYSAESVGGDPLPRPPQ
jgi:hypothetical protein